MVPSLPRRATVLATAGALLAAALTAAPAGAAVAETRAYGWGVDGVGQVGDGGSSDVFTPQRLALPPDTVQVAAGGYFGLAVTGDGTVYSWSANWSGQLGDGTTDPHADPRPVPGLTGIVQVSAGDWHALAVDGSGAVWSWGGNERGQLGDGTTGEEHSPHKVPGLTGITQVSAGSRFSLALRSDGTVLAWGANDWGELGDGTQNDSASPLTVGGLDSVVQVAGAVGGNHSVALRADGTVWGWGANQFAQLGTGSEDPWMVTAPVRAAGVSGATQVAAGEGDTLAVVDGHAWGWGGNYFGQLGDGTFTERPVPAPLGLDHVAQIASGYSNSAVRLADGTLWAWGNNTGGQGANGSLGTGATTTFVNQPAVVPGLAGVTQISLGFNDTEVLTSAAAG